MNYDITTYEFEDPDLKAAANMLDERQRAILILYLMGHRQVDIARCCHISRSMISKEFLAIQVYLRRRLANGF